MIQVVLRGLVARKTRAVLTGMAVVLGVAMISGTFVLIDTVMSAYSQIFRAAYVHTDAVVVAQSPFGATGTTKPALPVSLLNEIGRLPQVARTQGYIDSHAQLTDAAGVPIGKSSEEASLFGLRTDQLDAMNPLTLVNGAWPAGEGQIIVDEATANANHLQVGSSVGLVARKPLEPYRVVGLFRFAGAATLGPTQFVAVDLPVAQRILDKAGMVDEIDVAAGPGVSAPALINAIQHIAPATAKVTTAAAQANAATADVGRQFNLLRYALLAFGAIALFVGAFIIFNTLSITVTQRTRELGTLHALGASRRQLLTSILVEGTVIGVVASAVGLGVGIGFAKGLSALFASSGVHLPTTGTSLRWRTVGIGLASGLVVTLAASLAPALRAMRVPPILAIREGTGQPSSSGRAELTLTLALLSLGSGALVPAAALANLPTIDRLLLLAGGALLLFVGIAAASRRAIPGIAGMIRRLIEPFARVVGQLAANDTARNPGRTATTAGALTVGIALITFVAVAAQGLRQATGSSIKQQVTAAFVVTPQRDVLSPQVEAGLRNANITSASVRSGTVHIFTTNETMTGVVPSDVARFWHPRWVEGDNTTSLTGLDERGALVASDFAQAHHLHIGDQFVAQTSSGTTLDLAVRGIYHASKLAPLFGAVTITTSLFDRSFPTPGDREVLVDMTTHGDPTAGRATLENILRPFTTAHINTLNEFITSQQQAIAVLLNVFYVLLGLSVIVSIFGIVNTLALSISERTREIGMLRAVGMTRTQVRRMIRLESEIIAAIGAAVGIAVGLLLAALTSRVLAGWNLRFSVPWTTLVVLVVLAFVIGTLAAVGPARRAARLDPLTALTYE